MKKLEENKKICRRCYKEWNIYWLIGDDENWDERGFICCPALLKKLRVKALYSLNKMPLRCEYKLEHVVLSNETK